MEKAQDWKIKDNVLNLTLFLISLVTLVNVITLSNSLASNFLFVSQGSQSNSQELRLIPAPTINDRMKKLIGILC